MTDPAKHNSVPAHGSTALVSDLRSLLSIHRTRRTVAFLYGFMIASLLVTLFLAFNPSASSSGAPWLTNFFGTTAATGSSTTASSSSPSSDPYRSRFSSIFSYFFPTDNSSLYSPSQEYYTVASPPPPPPPPSPEATAAVSGTNSSRSGSVTLSPPPLDNRTRTASNSEKPEPLAKNHNNASSIPSGNHQQQPVAKSQTAPSSNQTVVVTPVSPAPANKTVGSSEQKSASQKSTSASFSGKQNNGTSSGLSKEQNKKKNKDDDLIGSLKKCDLFDGEWVRDDSYKPYYNGSCSLIDEQFNCILNGRPDKDYQKFKWKPKACNLPRLDGKHMLEMIRGKRLVFVGDSLNRNMWESLVCILKNAAKDPNKVFEAQGRHHFRGEASYSFIFQDYNCTVEFFVSPFLVQEWEVKDKSGHKKETLRLDLIGKSSEQYKGADVLVFNTGHWWTHDKTSKGEDYYQEGSHVYKQLNVVEAFRKAVTTWARWVDANVNPTKSLVLFRGYSHSHFSGGQWNSGGACDSETVPIHNETYLRPYPPTMTVLEKVLKGMKSDVTYLNVTKMTDFRKDGHPSIYRKQNVTPEERRSPLRFQDCSHWCLPGVPDAWNEVLYADLLVRLGGKQQQQQQQQKRT